MRINTLVLLGPGAALLLMGACVPQASDPAAMPGQADGALFFAENCTVCHGADGRGAGPEVATRPADLTQLSAENGGRFPTAEALSYIYGDPEQGHLARVMPQFGGAMAEDLVPVEVDGILTPTPRELAGLLAYLESIQQQ